MGDFSLLTTDAARRRSATSTVVGAREVSVGTGSGVLPPPALGAGPVSRRNRSGTGRRRRSPSDQATANRLHPPQHPHDQPPPALAAIAPRVQGAQQGAQNADRITERPRERMCAGTSRARKWSTTIGPTQAPFPSPPEGTLSGARRAGVGQAGGFPRKTAIAALGRQ